MDVGHFGKFLEAVVKGVVGEDGRECREFVERVYAVLCRD